MIGLGATVLLALAGGLGYVLARRRQGPSVPSLRPTVEAHRAAARAVGLDEIAAGETVQGRFGTFRVRFSVAPDAADTTLVEVSGLPPDVSIVRESVATAVQKRLGTRELETGDPAFDDELFVVGPALRLRATLDQETRALLVRVFRGQVRGARAASAPAVAASVELTEGVLQARIGGPSGLTLLEDVFGDAARALLEVAKRLEGPADPVAALTRNVREDPVPEVRVQSLRALVREYPLHEATRAALGAATSDADGRVRLEAGLALGDDGRVVLLELLDEPTLSDAHLAQVVEALRGRIAVERLRTVLATAVSREFAATTKACLVALGHSRDLKAIETLGSALELGARDVAVQAALSLGRTGDGRAEAPLLAALAHADEDVRAAAAGALGSVGSVEAVPALRDLEARDGEERAVRRAARVAVADIQSRLGGASPGQLALSEDRSGTLSLAPDGGRLSLPAAPTPEDARPRPRTRER